MGDGNWRRGYIDIGRRDRRGVSRGALILISFKLGLEIRAILLKVTFVTTEAAEAERLHGAAEVGEDIPHARNRGREEEPALVDGLAEACDARLAREV